MSFRKQKPRIILEEEEGEAEVEEDVPSVQFKKKRFSTVNQKRKNLKLTSFKDYFEGGKDDEADEIADLKIRPKIQGKFKKSVKFTGDKTPPDLMDIDNDNDPNETENNHDNQENNNYTQEYLEELKAQNNIVSRNPDFEKEETVEIENEGPTKVPYKIIESLSSSSSPVAQNQNKTIIPDALMIKELKERATRDEIQELNMKHEDFISIEDYDEEFEYKNKQNLNTGRNINDRNTDFEVDLHENFADDRLPLTKNEFELQQKSNREKIEDAIREAQEVAEDNDDDNNLEDQEWEKTQLRQGKLLSVESNANLHPISGETKLPKLKEIISIDNQLQNLKEKLQNFKNVKEVNEERLKEAMAEKANLETQKKNLSQSLDTLAQQLKTIK
ncbi:hypothetical protein PACTADRAFT_16070 [Pachysolen tannophilus NRRL Y-2460]|uniref:Uncharacterized protein n=1 Tax=Pachysolen tannophilus NRRL Y-2460 TaxID=669874 RepID=A0A1E4TVW8_PACTA|nr:hypothetical protein PACTADRAFT_16070 [Pachysolen tannophilus NRRL Y-2460]